MKKALIIVSLFLLGFHASSQEWNEYDCQPGRKYVRGTDVFREHPLEIVILSIDHSKGFFEDRAIKVMDFNEHRRVCWLSKFSLYIHYKPTDYWLWH